MKKILCLIVAIMLTLTACTEALPSSADGSSEVNDVSSIYSSSDESSSEKDNTSSDEESSSEGSSSEDEASSDENSSSEEVSSNESSKEETSSVEETVCTHTKTTVKNKVSATCTTEGYTGDTCCKDCGVVIKTGSTVKVTDHKTEIRNKKNATTTSEGYTGDTYCKTCGVKLESGETIPKIKNTQTENKSQTVYVTETGKKYHSRTSCSGLNNAKAIYESTLQNARNRGLGPCSKCY